MCEWIVLTAAIQNVDLNNSSILNISDVTKSNSKIIFSYVRPKC